MDLDCFKTVWLEFGNFELLLECCYLSSIYIRRTENNVSKSKSQPKGLPESLQRL